jgi:hypothetical protein
MDVTPGSMSCDLWASSHRLHVGVFVPVKNGDRIQDDADMYACKCICGDVSDGAWCNVRQTEEKGKGEE